MFHHRFHNTVPVLLLLVHLAEIISSVKTISSKNNDDNFSTKIDTLAVSLMKELRIPGLALSVVKNGEVITSSGYGYRNIDTREPVTNETLYSIGSITKSMTAMMVVKHFAERNISLDDPIHKYLGDSELQFSDKYRTNHLSMRDLLTHRTGIEVAGLNLLTDEVSDRNDYVSRIRYFPENTPIRTAYDYNNDMYLVAGWVLEKVTGKPWEQLVKEDILDPLEMSNSMLASEMADKFKELNAAQSYNRNDTESDVITPIDMETIRRVDPFNPAGGIVSNADDMAKYVQCYLNSGEGVLEKGLVNTMYTSGSPLKARLQIGANYSEVFFGYGLGLIPSIVQGHDMLYHDGGWVRQSSAMRFYPNLNIGIFSVVQDPDSYAGSVLNTMLQNGIFMILTEGHYTPEIFHYAKIYLSQTLAGVKAAEASYIQSPDQLSSNIKTQLPLSSYVGAYGSYIYGNLTITQTDDSKLNLSIGWASGILNEITNDTSKGIFELDSSDCSVYYDIQGVKVFVVFNTSETDDKQVQIAELVFQNAFVIFERDLQIPTSSTEEDSVMIN